jgi:hypothetical protein
MKNALFIFLILIFSCQPIAKENLVDINKMKIIVWQLMQVDEYYLRVSLLDSTWRMNKKNVQMYQQVFDLNKVDRTVFYKTIADLESHPDEFKKLMDSVNEVSKREKLQQIKH